MRLIDLDEIEGIDDIRIEDASLRLLAEVRDLPHFAAIQEALRRYQDKALSTVLNLDSDLSRIREAQGRWTMARQLLDLLENDAAAAYERRQKNDEDQDDQ